MRKQLHLKIRGDKLMKSILLLLAALSLSACASQTRRPTETASVAPKELKPWHSERQTEFRGDYQAEVFAGTISLHLRAYYDDQKQAIRYSACLINADDVMAKPSMEIWFDLLLTKDGLAEPRTSNVLFRPVIDAKGVRGILAREVYLERYD